MRARRRRQAPALMLRVGVHGVEAIVEQIVDSFRGMQAWDQAAVAKNEEAFRRLRKMPRQDRIRGYQELREQGVIDVDIATRLIFPLVEQLAGERANAALDKYPEALADDCGEAVFDAHIAAALREHGEEDLAGIWEDPEQRKEFLDAFADWQPADLN